MHDTLKYGKETLSLEEVMGDGYSKVCWVYNKEGHFRRVCPQRKTGKNKGKESKNEDLAAISQEFEFDSAEVLSISVNGPKEEWIMDSMCTFHMIPRRDLFFEYKSIDGGSVLMENNMTCYVVGIGSIKFKMRDGTIKILVEVRYIPDLKKNLVSLGMLDKNGYNYKSEGRVFRVMKNSLVMM